MSRSNSHWLLARTVVHRYGLAVVSVGVVLILALTLQHFGFRGVGLPLFLFAIALTSYSVSHDLRAPLRPMAGYAELLQKKPSSALDEKSRRYLTNIQEAAKKMGVLIDELLAFSRIGRVETQKTQVNLTQLANEVLNEVRQETMGRDVIGKIDALPTCFGDRSMLRLVFVNLISNAAKFTRARASIEIGCSEENSHGAEIYVRDNGVSLHYC
jgi:signal transduction histidine kinase